MKLANSLRILAIIVFCTTMQACSKSDSKENNNSNSAQNTTQTEAECLSKPNRICNQGLSFAQLGDSLASIKTEGAVIAAKDTLFSTEEMQWKGKILQLSKGQVLIEGTQVHTSDGEIDDANGGNVRAIRIETPLFETIEGVKVGSTFSELKKLHADSLFEVQPAAYSGLLQLRLPSISRINYFVKESAALPPAPGDEANMNSAKNISPEAKIEMISVEE
ncbi:MAG: hypothetical protein ACKVTZ_05545 [Bacteroidia bacterium]